LAALEQLLPLDNNEPADCSMPLLLLHCTVCPANLFSKREFAGSIRRAAAAAAGLLEAAAAAAVRFHREEVVAAAHLPPVAVVAAAHLLLPFSSP